MTERKIYNNLQRALAVSVSDLLNFSSPQISIPTTQADSIPVDQFIKLETEKIKSNEIKEENSEPEVTFTEERFQQKDWVYRLSFLQYVYFTY